MMTEKYKCIKDFTVPERDELGCPTGKLTHVLKDSVWEYANDFVGTSDVRMYLEDVGSDDEYYLDITYKTFDECFERVA